jgi:KDO2-lipid IV(A) lauroyltransferase
VWTLRLIGRLPFGLRSHVGFGLGYLGGLVPTRERTLAHKQLSMMLGAQAARDLTPSVFGNVARSLLESLNLTPITKQVDRFIRCDRWADVDRWIADPRPLIGLTAHTGNWDLLAAAMIARGARMATVAKEAKNPAVQAALCSIREAYGIETLWRSDRSGLKRLIECLREQRIVAALIDQDTRVESINVPFFGVPARTPSSLIALGKKMNARFVSAFLVREPGNVFRIFVEEIPTELSVEEILTLYSQHLENVIRKHPEQWVWFHKRWRSAFSEQPMSTKEYLHWLDEQLEHRQSNA